MPRSAADRSKPETSGARWRSAEDSFSSRAPGGRRGACRGRFAGRARMPQPRAKPARSHRAGDLRQRRTGEESAGVRRAAPGRCRRRRTGTPRTGTRSPAVRLRRFVVRVLCAELVGFKARGAGLVGDVVVGATTGRLRSRSSPGGALMPGAPVLLDDHRPRKSRAGSVLQDHRKGVWTGSATARTCSTCSMRTSCWTTSSPSRRLSASRGGSSSPNAMAIEATGRTDTIRTAACFDGQFPGVAVAAVCAGPSQVFALLELVAGLHSELAERLP